MDPRRRRERREALFQGARGVGGGGNVAAVTLDRSLRRLRPEQHFGAGVVAAFAGERSGDVDHGRGVRRDLRQSCTRCPRRRIGAWPASAAASASSASPSCCRVIVCVRRSSGSPCRDSRVRCRASSMPATRSALATGGRSTPGRHSQARSGVRPDCRYPPTRRIAGPAGEDPACRTSCRSGRGTAAGRPSSRASLPAGRRSRSSRPSRSRGR